MREVTALLNAMTVLILSGAMTEDEVRAKYNYYSPLPGRTLSVSECLDWLTSLEEGENEDDC